jgi:radical SAM protein with 4Fe4S-binding SPASM domain
MCPRDAYPQPKEDMKEEVFRELVLQAGKTAEHMMLIGLGEPFLDPLIFDRIDYCARHGVSTLLSTNGTLLDESTSERILNSRLEQITLSIDGATRETFEYYRRGARFEKVRDNFIRFARMKQQRRSKIQIVVQMVRLERNAAEVEEFLRFWSAVPGIDQVRIKEDETNLMRPGAGHDARDWRHPCHYLWRGPLYVRYTGDVYPCCQSYMLGGQPVGRIPDQPLEAIWNSEEMKRMRRLHILGKAAQINVCSRCCVTIPHPALVVGSLLLHGRTVRRLLPLIERLVYFAKLPRALLRPAKASAVSRHEDSGTNLS